MIPVQGDPAIALRGAGKQGPGALACALGGRLESAAGLAQHLKWAGGRALLLEQALRRGGIVQLEKGLMGPLECQGRPRQGQLLVERFVNPLQVVTTDAHVENMV
jgi:hypothetical protein